MVTIEHYDGACGVVLPGQPGTTTIEHYDGACGVVLPGQPGTTTIAATEVDSDEVRPRRRDAVHRIIGAGQLRRAA